MRKPVNTPKREIFRVLKVLKVYCKCLQVFAHPTGWIPLIYAFYSQYSSWMFFKKMESQTLISSKEFCIENMISCTQQMVFVSYKRICPKWDDFHDNYFFSPLYLSIFVKDFNSNFWPAIFAILLKTYIVICSHARDVKIGIFYHHLMCHL